MHNIDFDPFTHRVSMPLETFLGVIRDAGKPEKAVVEPPACGNTKPHAAHNGFAHPDGQARKPWCSGVPTDES